jgi:predicted site-specific integrase-resolvase
VSALWGKNDHSYESEVKEPMLQFCLDVIEIITVFSSKIYGLRAHSNRKTLQKPQIVSALAILANAAQARS